MSFLGSGIGISFGDGMTSGMPVILSRFAEFQQHICFERY
jgi:hypothetical protein